MAAFNERSEEWTTKIERKFGAAASRQFAEVLKNMFETEKQLMNDLESKHWNESDIMDTLHDHKAAFMDSTFCNMFYMTLKAITKGEEYNSNVISSMNLSNIFDECIRDELERIGYNKHDIMRISWREHSFCLVYSRSNKNWCIAKIKKTYIDNTSNEEWLIVKYGHTMKHIQRFCAYIKPIDIGDINTGRNACAHAHAMETVGCAQNIERSTALTLHFYGIMAPNCYKSHVCGIKGINSDLLVSIDSSLKRSDTIYSLSQLIRKIYNVASNIQVLIVFGDNIISSPSSENNDIKMRSFGITHHSLLLISICRPDRYRNVHKINTNTVNTRWNYTLSIKKRKGFDIITQQSNADIYKMPNCGHYMNKESLYEYCLNECGDANNVYLSCPHHNDNDNDGAGAGACARAWNCRYCTFLNDADDRICSICGNAAPPPKVKCSAAWNYCLIKQILCFDEDDDDDDHWEDVMRLEILLSRNKVQKECDLQQCPDCFTLYFKEKTSNINDIKTSNDIKKEFKTHCIRCDYWNNSFCFCCGKTWNYGHICDSSFKSDLLNILNKAETKRIGQVDDVPSIRCCPKCAQLITHTDACKHINCVSCSTDFCFVCLKAMVDDEWQCGSSGDVCPVAPRQSLKTLPNTIIINKKAFKLF